MLVREGRDAVNRGKRKAGLVFPVDRVHPIMREQLHARVDENVTLYIVAILEYISQDILRVSQVFRAKPKCWELLRPWKNQNCVIWFRKSPSGHPGVVSGVGLPAFRKAKRPIL